MDKLIIFLVGLCVIMAIGGCLFDYSLGYTFGIDIPWYADCIAGLFAPVLGPIAIVLFIIDCCGVPGPLIK